MIGMIPLPYFNGTDRREEEDQRVGSIGKSGKRATGALGA